MAAGPKIEKVEPKESADQVGTRYFVFMKKGFPQATGPDEEAWIELYPQGGGRGFVARKPRDAVEAAMTQHEIQEGDFRTVAARYTEDFHPRTQKTTVW